MIKNKYSLTIYIHNHCPDFVGDDFFLTGNMVNWKVDGCYLGKVPPQGESLQFVLEDVSVEELELKINRGSWQTLTASKEGCLLAPYQIADNGSAGLHIYIDAWRDQFKGSTASPQVQLMASSFYFPRLATSKRIWIYLPKDYEETDLHYPVLYMHDGQHLFDEATSQGRTGPVEWKVDKTIDASNEDAIVVAIAHAASIEERQQEYLLFPMGDMLGPKGADYLDDIVTTLKPFIDQQYRTRKEKQYTAMAGSSLGGLLTLEAGLLYPDTFGFLGVFSPSIWTSEDQIYALLDAAIARSAENIARQGYFYYAGAKEKRRGEQGDIALMLTNMLAFSTMHQLKASSIVHVEVDDKGKHGALYWQKVFPQFFASWQVYMASQRQRDER